MASYIGKTVDLLIENLERQREHDCRKVVGIDELRVVQFLRELREKGGKDESKKVKGG